MRLYVLLILALIIFFFSMKKQESFVNYDMWNLTNFNQNWNKVWKDPVVAHNNDFPQEIPIDRNDEKVKIYIEEIVKSGYLKKVLEYMRLKKIFDYKLEYADILDEELYRINKKTWHDRVYQYNVYNKKGNQRDLINFTTPESCIPDVNYIMKDFLTKFNKIFTSSPSERWVKYFSRYNDFSIFKYKIHNIKQSKIKSDPCIVAYSFILVLVRVDSPVGITIYMDTVKEGDKVEYLKFDIIGYFPTQKLFTFQGERSLGKKKHYRLNSRFRDSADPGTPNYNNVENILFGQQHYDRANTLQDQYACFATGSEFYDMTRGTKQTILTHTYNRHRCESSRDEFGRPKIRGLWDRPCKSDEECPFYRANKNYPNNYGKCNTDFGYCELPRGMKHLGYHKYVPYCTNHIYQPLCYNCKSVNKGGPWRSITKLDTCCEDQKDSGNYPFLKGPDYAFVNDIGVRTQIK